jgi:hypothetical protein
MISFFSEMLPSETEKYTLASLSIVIRTTFLSGAVLEDTELGVVTVNASGGLNLVANMKNDSNRNATSHIAVMSMDVLLRGILALGIFQ